MSPDRAADPVADGAAVQAELPGNRAVAPTGTGQGLHGLDEPSGVAPGSRVRGGVLAGLLGGRGTGLVDRG